jgi:hypothetical protein
MSPRAYRDVGMRVLGWPGRAWCQLWHRSMYKPWGVVDSRHGSTWMSYRCRICWRLVHGPRRF